MDRKCLGLAGWPISWWHLPRCRGGSIRPWRSRWWNALIFGAPKIRKLYNCTACAAAGHWYIMIHHDTSCSQCFATTFVKYSALCEGTSEQEQWILDITITQAWTTKRHKRPVWVHQLFFVGAETTRWSYRNHWEWLESTSLDGSDFG